MPKDLVADLSGRPAPQSIGTGTLLLVFILLAAPLAWLLQTVANYGIVSYVCQGPSPPDPLGDRAATTLWWAVVAINLAAVALAAAATAAAILSWHPSGGSGPGAADSLVEPGEAHGSFLTSWGIVGSAWFAAGILFSTVALAVVPLCAA